MSKCAALAEIDFSASPGLRRRPSKARGRRRSCRSTQLVERATVLMPNSGLVADRVLDASAGERKGAAAAGAPEELQDHDDGRALNPSCRAALA
jgi:hypothetical protein